MLSRDGKFLAYALFPQEGDGQLVVRNLATGKEVRENAGTPPPAAGNGRFGSAAPEQAAPAGPRTRIVFSYDNRFVAASSFPNKAETDKAVKERKRPDEMPKNSMLIVDVTAMTVIACGRCRELPSPGGWREFRGLPEGTQAGAGDDSGRRRRG